MKKSRNDVGRMLTKLLGPVGSALNPEAARKLIGLRANAADQARVAKLAAKCNNGDLDSAERLEYEGYVLAGEIIAILQAQARVVLARHGQTV